MASISPPPPPVASYPPTRIFMRSKESSKVLLGPPTEPPRELNLAHSTVSLVEDAAYVREYEGARPASAPLFAKDGSVSASITAAGAVVIAEGSTGAAMRVIRSEFPTQQLEFSPLGTFLVTWGRIPPSAAAAAGTGAAPKANLQVWRVSSGELVVAYSQKSYRSELVQWTEDEAFCCRLVSNEVHILDGHRPEGGIVGKVHQKGCTAAKLNPLSSKPYVAAFSPAAGGKPAVMALYRYVVAQQSSSGAGATAPSAGDAVTQRTAPGAGEANLYWAPSGNSVLVHTHSDVDTTNTSYYGASGLSILSCRGCYTPAVSADGKTVGLAEDALAALVPQGADGAVHDVRWSPTGANFVVIAGKMPASISLHNDRGDRVYDFGSAHRNTASWSPTGRFLVLAGFGNLVGDMDFYDIQAGKNPKKVGSNNAHCSVSHGWSPDSRYFLTATLAPRMNVDNGIKVFRYDGAGPVYSERRDQTYEAMWLPALPTVYPNRGRSPARPAPEGAAATAATATATATAPTAASGGAAAAASKAPSSSASASASTGGAYRPPGSTGSLAAMMRREAAPKGKVTVSATAPTAAAATPAAPTAASGASGASGAGGKYVAPQRKIPGLAPAPAASTGTGKANTSGSAAKATTTTATGAPKASSTSSSKPSSGSTVPPPAPPSATSSLTDAMAEAAALDKKVKALRKKLKQIAEFREQHAQSGEALNDDQRSKLSSEAGLMEELNALLAAAAIGGSSGK